MSSNHKVSRDGEQAGMEPIQILSRARRLQKLLDGAGRKPEEAISRTAKVLLAPRKEGTLGKIETCLAHEAAHRILEERLFPIPKKEPLEGVQIGALEDGRTFRYPREDQPTGALLMGAPKSGKTTAVISMAEHILSQGNGVLIPDVRGDFQEFVCSATGALYVPSQDDRINPLCPPEGVPRDYWIPVIAARLTLDLSLQTAAFTYLVRKLVELHEGYPGEIPTLLDLLEFLHEQRPRRGSSEEGYRERVVGRLEALVLQIGRDVLDVQKGFPVIERVEQGRLVVLDMRKMDKLVADFLLSIRLYNLYYKRLLSSDPFGAPLVFVVLDEQRSLIRDQSHDYGIPDIELLFSRSRALNMAFLVLEQIPSAVSPAVLSASRLRIGFHSAPPEQRIVAQILGLNKDQAEKLVKLPPGKGIARYASDTIPDPFLIDIQQPRWMA